MALYLWSPNTSFDVVHSKAQVHPSLLHLALLLIKPKYLEMKRQLDATDGSLLQNLLFAQHVWGTIMPIIRSSRVLYRWLLLVVLGALVFKLSVWRGTVGCVFGLRDAAAS